MQWPKYKSLIIQLLDALEFNHEIIKLIKESPVKNQHIFIAGNGGSAATASHFHCDLSKGAVKDWENNKNRFKAISLVGNTPYFTAVANDTHYDRIFSEQLRNLAKPNDILIAISCSGNSGNIIEAVKYAKSIGMIVIGLTGYDGGKLKEMSDHNIHVDSDCIEACEDLHHIFGHFLAKHLRES